MLSHNETCMYQIRCLSQAAPGLTPSLYWAHKASWLGFHWANKNTMMRGPNRTCSLKLEGCIVSLSSNNSSMSMSTFMLQMKPLINLYNSFLFFKALCCCCFYKHLQVTDSYVPVCVPVVQAGKTQDMTEILVLPVCVETQMSYRPMDTRLRNEAFFCLPTNTKKTQMKPTCRNKERKVNKGILI